MLELLQDPWWRVPLAALLGLFVGSFLNVLIHRLPKMMEAQWQAQAAELRGEPPPVTPGLTLSTPRSRCPHCAHPIGALQNIPLISYLVLRGRCAHCKAPIGLRYPLVEMACALLSGLAAWQFGPGLSTVGALVFVWLMLALTFIDLDTQLLPDSLTLLLLWLGLLINLHDTYTPLSSAVIGAAAGYLSLWCVYWAFKLLTGKEGMGFGDFKLLAAIGAWVGWAMLPMVLLMSSLVGAVTGIAMMLLAGHQRETPIPFGPYLAAAGVVALFWGPQIMARYY